MARRRWRRWSWRFDKTRKTGPGGEKNPKPVKKKKDNKRVTSRYIKKKVKKVAHIVCTNKHSGSMPHVVCVCVCTCTCMYCFHAL